MLTFVTCEQGSGCGRNERNAAIIRTAAAKRGIVGGGKRRIATLSLRTRTRNKKARVRVMEASDVGGEVIRRVKDGHAGY